MPFADDILWALVNDRAAARVAEAQSQCDSLRAECRVAELSLIMTLLDYIDPPDLEHTNFKLPTLRNQNIFEGDFFDVDGPAFDLLSRQKFDWIVGNPPWAEAKGIPAKDHEHYKSYQWMVKHKKTHPTSGNQLAEAFIWKAGDHLSESGACGLVVLAMTWFKKEAIHFRQRLFSERRVWCLANFANMGFVLFARRSNVGASVVFFEPVTPSPDDAILTFSPFVAEQLANRPIRRRSTIPTWNIVVGASDLREIENSQAQSGDSLTWKLAMWGTPRDRKLLERLDERFKDERFSSLDKIGVHNTHQGLELRLAGDAANEEVEHHPELIGKKKLLIEKLKGLGRVFTFPDFALGVISSDECYVRKGRAKLPIAVSSPPHVVLDASRRFAVYSDDFIAIPSRQIGIAGTPESSQYLQALSLYLSSDFCTYHQFLATPQWGIDMNRADLHALLKLPVPLSRLSQSELNDWGELQQQLAALSMRQFASFEFGSTIAEEAEALVAELNDRVFKLLGLRKAERWLIHDFVHLQMELTKGKVTDAVTRMPTLEERQGYLLSLRECLDGFFSTDRGLRHKLEILADRESAMLSVSLGKSKVPFEPVVIEADNPASRSLKTIRDRLRAKHSQWVYFDRNLKVYDPKGGVLYQFKPLQRLHWTRRQAVLDADDIIAETMTQGGVS